MKIASVVIASGVVIVLLVAGKDFLIPLVLAVFFWILIRSLKAAFECINIAGRCLPSASAFTLALLTIIAASSAVGQIVGSNISKIVKEAPGYEELLGESIADGFAAVGLAQPPTVRQLIRSLDLFQLLTASATAVAALVGQAGLVAVYVLFLFLEERIFAKKLRALFPDPERRRRIKGMLSQLVDDVRTYVGVKSLASLMVAAPCYLLMSAAGLDFASFWGLLIFILNFVPNIGSAVATILPSVLAFLQFEDAGRALFVAGGIWIFQVLVAYVIEPRLIGRSVNLSPLVVILSLVLWWALWGVPGMFLCVPIMVSLMILCAQFPRTRPIAIIMSRAGRVVQSVGRGEVQRGSNASAWSASFSSSSSSEQV